MKYVLLIATMLALTSCGTLHQHRGEISQDVTIEDYSEIDMEKGGLSTIICAQGERRYFATGTSKPGLSIQFDDEGFTLFKSSYEAVRLNAKKRNFTLKFTYKDQYSNFKVRNFEFEPNTTYYAKYSTTSRSIKVWIEKDSGEVIYGKKPIDGQF